MTAAMLDFPERGAPFRTTIRPGALSLVTRQVCVAAPIGREEPPLSRRPTLGRRRAAALDGQVVSSRAGDGASAGAFATATWITRYRGQLRRTRLTTSMRSQRDRPGGS